MWTVMWQLSSNGARGRHAGPSVIALSSPQICRPASFTGACVRVCPRGPLPPTGPITLTSAADPTPTDLDCSVRHRSIAFTACVFLEALPLPVSCPAARACPRAPAPRLKEHVHVSRPVKVTPYASCRDNEGFNFTTQAYQIAAPRSLRHALAT